MDTDAQLGDFLSRPVRIFSTTWVEGTVLDTQLDPWDSYFNTPSIRKKLDNYGLLRCNLKLKFMINASPFYYGLLLASYHPATFFNYYTSIPNGTDDSALLPLSQRPHIWMYPQHSQGGTMKLPFFSHKNWLNATLRTDFIGMGTISLDSVGVLENANSVAGTDVTLTVYAWAEDVELAGPTMGLALQSSVTKVNRSKGAKGNGPSLKKNKPKVNAIGSSSFNQKFKDEYGKGVVETAASAVVAASNALSEVPVIGPFMTATSVVASAAGQVASYFGWSNPPVVSDVSPFKNTPFHAMSSSEISNPVEKLTFDPKNELCVDSRTVGLDGTDELSIASLVERESYIVSFDWPTTAAPGTMLWGTRVNPRATRVQTPTNAIFGVPMAYLSEMFKYWHGDIIYRFQVIASQYHRGRIRISWDPLLDLDAYTDTEMLTYTETYDITEQNDFEIRIPWMQVAAWARTDGDVYGFLNWDPSGGPGLSLGYDNGKLNVRVLTQLTAPDANAPVHIAVSVRAAENFAFTNPRPITNTLSHFTPQSSVKTVGKQSENDVNACEMTNTKDEIEASYLIYSGEVIKSLRTILRRYVYYRTFSPSSETAGRSTAILSIQGRYPLFFGYDPSGINFGEKAAPGTYYPFNYVVQTPLAWISSMFIGQRGSINYRVNARTTEVVADMDCCRLPLTGRSAGDHHAVSVISNTNTINQSSATIFARPNWKSLSGLALTHQRTQTGFEVSLPMYSRFRMNDTNPHTKVLGATVDETNQDTVAFAVNLKPASSGIDAKNTIVDFYVAAGIDYTCFFFLNCPAVWKYSSIPAAQP